jgi:hypothetical protein
VRLRDCKEHGLGLYIDPKGHKNNPQGWIWDTWQWEVENALGIKMQRPAFFDRLAVTRLVFSTPIIARPFDDLSLGSRIRPFRFMLTASARPKDASLLGLRTRYVAPFEKDPERWPALEWVNLYSHESFAREARTLDLETVGKYIFDWEARARVAKMVTVHGKRVTVETRGLLVPMHVVATKVLQTGRETVDSEPIEDEETDWRDALEDGGTGEPASAAMRHQVFIPEDNKADDALRTAIKESDNVAGLAREANLGRQTVYDFLTGGSLRPKTRKKIEAALRRFSGSKGNIKEP